MTDNPMRYEKYRREAGKRCEDGNLSYAHDDLPRALSLIEEQAAEIERLRRRIASLREHLFLCGQCKPIEIRSLVRTYLAADDAAGKEKP